MKFGLKREVGLCIDDCVHVDDHLAMTIAMAFSSCPPVSLTCICRICHEEEEESYTTMESPCSCSGTLKFAHRECIQKWCDEKGSNVCEICLQKYEPGYTIPEKKALAEVPVTIRDSLEVPRLNYDPPSDGEVYADYVECDSTTHRNANLCRYVAIIFTVMLLTRHVFALADISADDNYTFTVFTLFLLRASGILLPFYLVMRFISAVQEAQKQNYYHQLHFEEDSYIMGVEENYLEQHIIEIQS